MSDEANKCFESINKMSISDMPKDWQRWANSMGYADDNLLKFLNNSKYAEKSLDNYTKYLNENSKALTVNTVKTKALNIAKSAALNIGIALGTALVGKGIEIFYENVIKANEKAIDTANDLQNKYQDLQSEVTSLEEKLQDNQKKIEDINANPLNIINENTLTALQKENGELERQLELKRQLAEDAKRESGAAAYDILNKKTERSSTKKTSELQAMLDSGYAGKWINSFGHWLNAALGGGNTSAYISVPERAKEQIEELSELKNKLREFDSDSITYDKDTADITEKINSQTEALRKNIEFIGKQKSAYDLTDPEQKEQYDYLVKLEDAYLALQVYAEDMDSFDEIWNAKATANQKNELIELAKQGELTAEKFEKDYHVLAVLFEALGYSIDEIIEKLKGMETESIIPKTTEDFQKTFDELNKQIDKIQSAYSTVKSAIEEYNEQGYLSVDTYQELLQLTPEYMSMLIDENGQLTLTKDSWRLLTEAKIKDMYQTQVNQYVESLKAAADSGNKEKIDELTDAYRNLTEAKVDASTVSLADLNLSDEQRAGAEAYLASLKDAMNATISGLDYGGMNKQDKSTRDKANKIKEINKKLAELSKKESLEILKQGIEEQKALIDQFTKSVDIQDLKLELADDSDYSTKMDVLSSKYDLLHGKTAAMRSEFERLNRITPTSADEAQELASRMESLGDEMRSNVKDVIELRREMELLNVDMVSKSAENAQAQLERTMKRLDHDIKNITDGNIFSDNVFNIDSMLPVVSESALTKKRKENDKLIREEERYQSDINRIILTSLQMQKEENAQARAEERASLLEDLNELKGVVSTKSAEIKQEATQKANETSVEVLNKVGEIKSGITTAIGDIANMTIEPPKMNTEAWDNLENDIKDRFNRILSPAANSSADAMSAVGLASQFVGQNNTGFRFSGGRNEEWCADFVSYIADMAGIPIEQLPRSPGVIDFYNFFTEHGGNLNTPKPGDIVIFDKGKHIGFVEAVTENGITTIEGNTRNRNNEKSLVTRNNYSLDDIKKRNMTFGRYASGGYADGYAVVGDNPSGANVKRPELAIYPDGRVEVVGQNGVELKDFPPGTRIIPYDKAKEILSRTSSVPRYADGTNEAQRKKFNDLVSKYSTPNYYDKSFANGYADYANGRSITITNIKATVDKLTDLDINSEDFKNLRRSALDMVDAQRLSDAEMLLRMQESELKKTGASYQEFYDVLLAEYRDYIEKVNAEDSEEIYDEEVVQKYIDTLSDLEDKIGDVNDEMSSLLQTTIETYQKLDSIKIQKGRELVSQPITKFLIWNICAP